jgi:hypothetical protein
MPVQPGACYWTIASLPRKEEERRGWEKVKQSRREKIKADRNYGLKKRIDEDMKGSRNKSKKGERQ